MWKKKHLTIQPSSPAIILCEHSFFSFHQFVRHQLKLPKRETNDYVLRLKSHFRWVTIFQNYLVAKGFLHLDEIKSQHRFFVVLAMRIINSKNSSKCKNNLLFPPQLTCTVCITSIVDCFLYLQQVYWGEGKYSFTNEPCSLLRSLPKRAFRKQTWIYYIDNYFSIF